jgi:integrating conjugative element membrane protein (TIGR03747 family)
VKKDKELPQRKEPGLLGKGIGSLIAFIAWMVMALLISILIEWAGIAWFWPEQGVQHSRDMVNMEYRYLNHKVKTEVEVYRYQSTIIKTFNTITVHIAGSTVMSSVRQMTSNPVNENTGRFRSWMNGMIREYSEYVYAAFYITQLFFIRLAIILLSLTVFVLFGMVGIADGLTERELRRWGAGRESSTMFNLAKRMIYPAFIVACVLYISFPTTIHPALIMVPFGALFGYSLKVGFEKLKKYF